MVSNNDRIPMRALIAKVKFLAFFLYSFNITHKKITAQNTKYFLFVFYRKIDLLGLNTKNILNFYDKDCTINL